MRGEYQTKSQSPSLKVGAIECPETLTVPNLLTNSSLAHKFFAYIREKRHRNSALEGENLMKLFQPKTVVLAHCDLPCGVYDPAQAKIEALSVKACMEKYAASSDADFKSRSVAIKEERSHQVKEHLWVLWTDYFKPNHFEAYPQLHTLFNDATKLAGAAGTKGTNDVAVADKLIGKIDEIAEIFWATKK
jgi:nickel superoxide dismutase